MADTISVVVTTYNRDDALDAVLRALSKQTDRDFEVIVADDGSGPSTAALIERWASQFIVPLSRVWHEDRGFRAGEIRNRAILAARGDYVVFLDGDCLARPGFIAAHRQLAEHGWFVTGNRILLSRPLTESVLGEQSEPESWSLGQWFVQRCKRGINRLAGVLTLPLGPLRKLRPKAWQDARSCNLGVWRADLERVDGFDAAFSGWGREDSDLLVRLLRAGIRRKDGAFATGVLHLWHPAASRSQLVENERRLEAVVAGDRIRAEAGLSALRGQVQTAPATGEARD